MVTINSLFYYILFLSYEIVMVFYESATQCMAHRGLLVYTFTGLQWNMYRNGEHISWNFKSNLTPSWYLSTAVQKYRPWWLGWVDGQVGIWSFITDTLKSTDV